MDFTLAPGEEKRETVTFKIRKPCDCIWLQTNPSGDIAVPARKLLFAPSMFEWAILGVPDPGGIDRIDQALLKAPARTISRGSQKVAVVKLACSEAGLIFHAHYLQPVLKPNPETPWTGTALELIAYQCAPEGTPHWKMPERRQVFLVPLEEGIVVRRLDALGTGTEPSPLVKATSKPVEGGWDIAALIPWQEFGIEKRPKDFHFDLIVDILDPQAGQLTQISAFDLPSDGWRRLYGKLICGK